MLADVVLEEACTGACRIGQCFQLQWVWNCDLDDVKVSDDETIESGEFKSALLLFVSFYLLFVNLT